MPNELVMVLTAAKLPSVKAAAPIIALPFLYASAPSPDPSSSPESRT